MTSGPKPYSFKSFFLLTGFRGSSMQLPVKVTFTGNSRQAHELARLFALVRLRLGGAI